MHINARTSTSRPHATAGFPAVVSLFAAAFFSAGVHAETGIDVSGSVAQEEYRLPLSTITVDWQRVTVSPWWENADWRVSADLPFVSRDAERRGLAGALLAAESDSGLGDARLRAKRHWQVSEDNADFAVTTYVGASVKLATGDETAGTLVVPGAVFQPTRQGQYSLGSGSTDISISPGVTAANNFLWATAEAGYIVSNGGTAPQNDRPTAYLGIGITPAKFIEVSVDLDYEGEVAAGSGSLQQVTYTLTLTPIRQLSLSLSTYDDNSNVTPDSNWSLGVGINY